MTGSLHGRVSNVGAACQRQKPKDRTLNMHAIACTPSLLPQEPRGVPGQTVGSGFSGATLGRGAFYICQFVAHSISQSSMKRHVAL